MNLRYASESCEYLLDNLLKKVHTQCVNRSLEKYANQKMPIQSVQFFNNTQKQVVFNQTFKPSATIQSQEKEPTCRHSSHAIKFISSEPNTKRVSQVRKSAFLQLSIKKQIPKISNNISHKKYFSNLSESDKKKQNNQISNLIPLIPQNFEEKQGHGKNFDLINKRNSNLINTEQYIDSLRTKKKKIQEAFSSFLDPKSIQENTNDNQTFKKKISNKQLLNLQIVTSYEGDILPLKKSLRRFVSRDKLSQLPSYRIKTEINSNYPEIQSVNIKTLKPFTTFKNVSSSIISNESTEKEIMKKSTKMVSILDLKSQKQNASMFTSHIGSKKYPYDSKQSENMKGKKVFNLQDMVSCTRSRRMIQAKKNKSKNQTPKDDQYQE